MCGIPVGWIPEKIVLGGRVGDDEFEVVSVDEDGAGKDEGGVVDVE